MTYVPNIPERHCRHAPLWTYSHAIINVKHVCLIFLTPCVSQVATTRRNVLWWGLCLKYDTCPGLDEMFLIAVVLKHASGHESCTETVKPYSDVKGILNLKG